MVICTFPKFPRSNISNKGRFRVSLVVLDGRSPHRVRERWHSSRPQNKCEPCYWSWLSLAVACTRVISHRTDSNRLLGGTLPSRRPFPFCRFAAVTVDLPDLAQMRARRRGGASQRCWQLPWATIPCRLGEASAPTRSLSRRGRSASHGGLLTLLTTRSRTWQPQWPQQHRLPACRDSESGALEAAQGDESHRPTTHFARLACANRSGLYRSQVESE